MIAELNSLLEETGLSDVSGKLLYSGADTLRAGELYVLGFNPGGDAENGYMTVSEHLKNLKPAFNEYLDGRWGKPGEEKPAGSKILQRRVNWMLKQLDYDTRQVCASNLIFARSRHIQNLTGNLELLVEACWPVHEFIIRTVKPKAIIALGQKTFEQIRRQTNLNPVEHFSSGHADWQVSATTINFYGREITLVAPPHLSIYKIDAHQDVITWIKDKIELGAT